MRAPLDASRCALVLVDYQERLLPAILQGDSVVREAARLADCARALDLRVVGTEQNPAGLGPNAEAIRGRCDATLAKMHFDACADGLADLLRAPGHVSPADVVVAGCETHVCLLQTALGLARAGFAVTVAADACGSRFAPDRELALRRMESAGLTLASVESIVFEWLGASTHPRFRAVLEILKAPRA